MQIDGGKILIPVCLLLAQALATFCLYGWHASRWGGVLTFELALSLPLLASFTAAPNLLKKVLSSPWAILFVTLALGFLGTVLGIAFGVFVFGE
ncbi:MAG TPA: hypothetical protein VK188_06700 [Holophaga sp.]|nr:hypothetical protein [Holophaga sp.]